MRSLLVSSDTAIPVAPNVSDPAVAAPPQPMASIASLKVTPCRSLRASAMALSSMPAQTTRPRTAYPRTFAPRRSHGISRLLQPNPVYCGDKCLACTCDVACGYIQMSDGS